MNKLFSFLVLFTLLFNTHAQRHEIGVFLGGANGITDIGRTDYIYPFPQKIDKEIPSIPYAVGAIYRFNLNPQMGLRANLMYAKIIGNDINAREDYRFTRGLNYKNNIIEGSILFEYNFFDFNTIQKSAHTPYIFAGIGAFASKELTYAINHTPGTAADGTPLFPDPANPNGFISTLTGKEKFAFNYNIPFGAGYKFKYNWNWVIGAEIGVRATNTDKLDYSIANVDDFTITTDPLLEAEPFQEVVNTRNQNFITPRQTGDVSDMDWYVFTGLTLTYTFGRPPCYCN